MSMHFTGDLRTTYVKYGWCNPTLVIIDMYMYRYGVCIANVNYL